MEQGHRLFRITTAPAPTPALAPGGCFPLEGAVAPLQERGGGQADIRRDVRCGDEEEHSHREFAHGRCPPRGGGMVHTPASAPAGSVHSGRCVLCVWVD